MADEERGDPPELVVELDGPEGDGSGTAERSGVVTVDLDDADAPLTVRAGDLTEALPPAVEPARATGTGGRAALAPRLDRDLLVGGWARPTAHAAVIVGLLVALSALTGAATAFVATGNLDAVRPGVPAGVLLFFAAFGADVSVVVEHPAAVVGFDVDAVLVSWVAAAGLACVVAVARAWRRLGVGTGAAWAYAAKLAILVPLGVAVVGVVANREIVRGSERIVSTASVGSAIVRSPLVVVGASLFVLAASGWLRARPAPDGTEGRRLGVVRLWDGAKAGVGAAFVALFVFGIIGVGVAVGAAPGLRNRLPVAVLAPQLAGNVAGLTAPVALGGATEVGAAQTVSVGVDGARAVDVERVTTSLGRDRTISSRRGSTPITFLLALLVLPVAVAVATRRSLQRLGAASSADRSLVVAGVVVGAVTVLGAVVALAPLRASGIVADPDGGVAVLGSTDLVTAPGRAAWLALVWSSLAAGLTGFVWASRHPAPDPLDAAVRIAGPDPGRTSG